MKNFLKYAFIAMLAVSLANCSKDGQDGKDGIDGINGENGQNGQDGKDGKTILSGRGVPSASEGNIGDFYMNLENSTLYGPKTANGWGEGVSLIGAKGQNGQNGQDGKDGNTTLSGNGTPADNLGKIGDFYLNLDNYHLFGPKTTNGWGNGVALKTETPNNNTNTQNAIKGTWMLQKKVINEKEYLPNECEKQFRFIFSPEINYQVQENKYILKDFSIDKYTNECTSDEEKNAYKVEGNKLYLKIQKEVEFIENGQKRYKIEEAELIWEYAILGDILTLKGKDIEDNLTIITLKRE